MNEPLPALTEPVRSVAEYLARGGGQGLAAALTRAPAQVTAEVRRSGLRGRGGSGFPTGQKWQSVRAHPCETRYLVCNAAEGEPATFKDRWIIRRNPYQVLEGIAIAAYAIGAVKAYIVIKERSKREIEALRRAMAEMPVRVPVEITAGPDDYLFGEEKAAVEVIEGREALPRILPPYQVGLFARSGRPNPTVVNNVETLANLPLILRRGADWFRESGTPGSPGGMVFTLCGDIRRPGMYELPLGLSLDALVRLVGGGPREGRRIKVVVPGASAAPLPPERFGTPLDFDLMRAAGSALGSGGFAVYDDTACMVAVTLGFARFLADESCGQCPACKRGCTAIADGLERIERGAGGQADLRAVLARCETVTGGRRCALPAGADLLVRSAVETFREEFEAHLGRSCPRPRRLPFPLIADFGDGRFSYETREVAA
ncbi:MAG TPA: NADH-ubiquinone oxidoreductase-F iron-sulfur binding region domain-containing protein [Actinomadura sp.]|jgi:NADH:ubiquinone oxidoreductase subunit F (NADH-binding)|nr:NADH-ubiquinone oxidoreductase-F iron-sulfur binding region domain-containing protein [Actinomadura sp.]